jgi:serine/threonine protein kinase
LAPELLESETATAAVDIWVLGIPIGLTDCMLFDELLVNHDPIFSSNQKPWSPFFTRTVRRMMIENVQNRITAAQILAIQQISDLPPTWLLSDSMVEPNSEIFWEDA